LTAALLVLFAGAAGASIIAANLWRGPDERGLGVAMAVRMAMVVAVVMPVIVRMIMTATTGVIDCGFKGFAWQGRHGLGLVFG
jgi:hypothetical protein